MANRTKLFEDGGRIFFQGKDPNTIVHFFKDEALINEETVTINGKGAINNQLSERLHQTLQDLGMPTTFMRRLNMKEQLHIVGELIPLRIQIHNYTDEEVLNDYGVEPNTKLPYPLIEFKAPTQHVLDKPINPELAEAFGWVSKFELEEMKLIANKVNDIVFGFFRGLNYNLAHITLEFTRIYKDEYSDPVIYFSGQLTPETCTITAPHFEGESKNSLANLQNFYNDIARLSKIIKED